MIPWVSWDTSKHRYSKSVIVIFIIFILWVCMIPWVSWDTMQKQVRCEKSQPAVYPWRTLSPFLPLPIFFSSSPFLSSYSSSFCPLVTLKHGARWSLDGCLVKWELGERWTWNKETQTQDLAIWLAFLEVAVQYAATSSKPSLQWSMKWGKGWTKYCTMSLVHTLLPNETLSQDGVINEADQENICVPWIHWKNVHVQFKGICGRVYLVCTKEIAP